MRTPIASTFRIKIRCTPSIAIGAWLKPWALPPTTFDLTGPVLDLTGQTTLPQLAAVLSVADLMLANDTGPLHLAVALGRPVVAPYTCTRVQLTGPYRRPSSAVETGVWCAGSLVKQCARLD